MSDDYSPQAKVMKMFENSRSPRSSKVKCEHLLSLTFSTKNENIECSDLDEESEIDSYEDPEYKEEMVSDESDEEINKGQKSKQSFLENNNNNDDDDDDDDDDNDMDDSMSNISDFSYVKEVADLLQMNDMGGYINNNQSDTDSVITSFSVTNFRNQNSLNAHSKQILLDIKKKIKDKQYGVAIEYCNHFIDKESPFHYEVYDLLADVYEAMEDYNTMKKHMKTACLLDRANVGRWTKCVNLHEKVDGVNSAIEIAKQANRWTHGKLRLELIKLFQKSGNEREMLIQKLDNYKFSKLHRISQSEMEPVVEELIYMQERFEALGDMYRSNTALKLLAINFPKYLSNIQKIYLVKDMLKQKSYTKILDIGKTIPGVSLQLTNLSENIDANGNKTPCIQFSRELSKEDRPFIILGILLSVLKRKFYNMVKQIEFADNLAELSSKDVCLVIREMYDSKYEKNEYMEILDCVKSLISRLTRKSDIIEVLKLKAQCLAKIRENRSSLSVYELILSDYTKEDATVWKNMVELLFKMNAEKEAKRVIMDCMDILTKEVIKMSEGKENEEVSSNTGLLLYSLLEHYEKVSSREKVKHYIWHFLWLDSAFLFRHFSNENLCGWNLNQFLNDKSYTNMFQTSLVLMLEYKLTEDNINYKSIPSMLSAIDQGRCGYKSKIWVELKKLIDMLVEDCKNPNQSEDELMTNLSILELLCTWGFLLYKLLSWTSKQKNTLSILMMTVGLQSRSKNMNVLFNWCHILFLQSVMFIGRHLYLKNVHFWNLYSVASVMCKKFNTKFLLRLMEMDPDNKMVQNTITANMVVRANLISFKLCLTMNENFPENPQTWLQIAVVLSKHGCNRKCENPPLYVKYAIAFMQRYVKLRGECQETHYNLGRFNHTFSFYNRAILHYKRCLSLPPTGMDIRYAAAFNLAAILRSQKSPSLLEIVNKYLKI